MRKLSHILNCHILTIIIFMSLCIGTILVGLPEQRNQNLISTSTNGLLNSRSSTDADNPEILQADTPLEDFCYFDFKPCYYTTANLASKLYYQVVWLRPMSYSYDFDLYIYDNYSWYVESSTRGKAELDWVIFRPNISQFYHPAVLPLAIGSITIEWEVGSSTLTIGTVSVGGCSEWLDSIELYRAYLSSSSTYQISLGFSSTADLDLYIYYLDPGGAANYNGYLSTSELVGNGINESITITPTQTGYYAIMVVCHSGGSIYNLIINYSSDTSIGGFSLIATVIALLAAIALGFILFKQQLLGHTNFFNHK